MDFMDLLEEEPLFDLVRYASGTPQDAVAFVGTLRKHPYDRDKCLLLANPSAAAAARATPSILEFRKTDILGMEDLPSPVDEAGHSRQIYKLWVRRGSLGLRYEPFEVDEPIRFPEAAKLRGHALSGAGPSL